LIRTLQVVGNSAFGGGTYLIDEWSRYLIARGCYVDILSTDKKTIEYLKKVAGIGIIDSILIPRDISPIKDAQACFRLLKLLAEKRYDVVHTYTATPGFIGRTTARLMGVPVIVHHQAAWAVDEYSSFLKRLAFTPLEYFVTLISTKSICVSRATRSMAKRLHIAPDFKLATICNGIDHAKYIEARLRSRRGFFRAKLNIPEDHVLIGSTGRLAPQKDYPTLIKAFAKLPMFVPAKKLSLAIAGEGPDHQKLCTLATSLGVKDSVHLPGFIDDIPGFLSALDIFVSTSLREGLSISLLEAMAAELPIVASSIRPNAELIASGQEGLLVSPGSATETASAVAELIDNPQVSIGYANKARLRVVDEFSLDRMLDKTWKLYLDLLAAKGRCVEA